MKKEKQSIAQSKQKKLTEKTLSREEFAVSNYLSQIKLSPAFFGVDEADVWRKIEKLCELYDDALRVERAKAEQAERKLRAVLQEQAIQEVVTRGQ